MPASLASSTTYWISGLSTMVSISFGIALVAGRTRVPRPATGKTALRIFIGDFAMTLEGATQASKRGLRLLVPFATGNKGGCVVSGYVFAIILSAARRIRPLRRN